MSGTSLDGLDMALCRFEAGEGWNYEILAAETIAYDLDIRSMLQGAFFGSALDLLRADHALGEWIGRRVAEFNGKRQQVPDLVVSHGHTVFHQPDKGLTCQIGNGWRILVRGGAPVVNDLRALDVVLGGQGAPLVPLGDKLLFPDYAVCLNLGGFSNISYDDSSGVRKAFDVCPVNFVLNRLASHRGLAYDDGGRMARSGQSDEALLRRLDALPYYQAAPPKSLGQEWVDAEVMPLLDVDMPLENLMATYTLHAARQIDRAIRDSVPAGMENCRVLVTGGGALNNFLVELMSRLGEGRIRYELPDRQLIDYKEALIFAFLGLLKWKGEINTLRSVTGASRDASGGAVYTF